MSDATRPVRVVYVVGKGRSGSTLLDQALGSIEGWVSTGELFRIWDWGLMDDAVCGCGASFSWCGFWNEVMGRLVDLDPARVLAHRRRVLRWRAAPGLLAGWISRAAPDYAASMGRLYRAIAESSGSRVVVDSSKWPFDPVLLGLVPGVEVSPLMLVRDPRAVAHSWQHAGRHRDGTGYMALPRFPPWHSAASWSLRQLAVEFARYRSPGSWCTLRYEDFVAAPAATLRDLVAAVGVGVAPNAGSPDQVLLDPHHMIGGNPGRSQTGLVTVHPDDEWHGTQGRLPRATVSAITWPLLRRYRYR